MGERAMRPLRVRAGLRLVLLGSFALASAAVVSMTRDWRRIFPFR